MKCFIRGLNNAISDDGLKDVANNEMFYVLQRLGQCISESEFSQLIRGSSSRTADIVIDAVEETIRGNPSLHLPAKVDLFVVESIFKPRPKEVISSLGLKCKYSASHRCSISALDEATEEFKVHATNERVHPLVSPLSWGNTNSRTREFQTPLQVAAQTGRPVEFIIFGGKDACDKIQGTDGKVVDNCLPLVDLKTLVVRNLNRFVQTGRYIPTAAIADTLTRVRELVNSAVSQANRESGSADAKFRLDAALVKVAGFRMKSDRTIVATNRSGDSNGGGGRGRGGRGDYGGRGGRNGRGGGSGRGGRGRGSYHGGRGRGRY